MLILLMTLILSSILSIVIMSLTIMTSEKSNKEREKMTPFECGFSPFKKARSPFSMRFFMITLIFLIFDIELALLMPLGILMKISNTFYLMFLSLIITFILLFGLLHEWKQGVLTWM